MSSPCSKKRTHRGQCLTPPAERSLGLARIVRLYISHCRLSHAEEIESFRKERTLRAAVDRASTAKRPYGKRYDHQRWLSNRTLEEVRQCLLGARLTNCSDFDRLHGAVESLIGSIPGVGELMVYDTSLRIGAKLGLLPSRVYLHRGTRDGAKALGKPITEPYLDPRWLPKEFQRLEPHEIEDCLCIFKDDF